MTLLNLHHGAATTQVTVGRRLSVTRPCGDVPIERGRLKALLHLMAVISVFACVFGALTYLRVHVYLPH